MFYIFNLSKVYCSRFWWNSLIKSIFNEYNSPILFWQIFYCKLKTCGILNFLSINSGEDLKTLVGLAKFVCLYLCVYVSIKDNSFLSSAYSVYTNLFPKHPVTINYIRVSPACWNNEATLLLMVYYKPTLFSTLHFFWGICYLQFSAYFETLETQVKSPDRFKSLISFV